MSRPSELFLPFATLALQSATCRVSSSGHIILPAENAFWTFS
jgi:hypothetical protein